MDETELKKRTLTDMARGLEEQRAQFGRDWRGGFHEGAANLQDAFTSNPDNDVLGPLAATAIEGAKSFIPDPELDPSFAGAAPSPPNIKALAELSKATKPAMSEADRLAKVSYDALKNLYRDELPKSLTPMDAKRVTDLFAKGKNSEAEKILEAARKTDTQGISRDVVTSSSGSSRIQPEPKVTGTGPKPKPKKMDWMDSKYGWKE